MTAYDWIVIGGGITGAAIAYELAQKQRSVLLLERDASLKGSTRFGYGGLAYWSGTTDLTRQICAEGRAIHPLLSEELDGNTQFRELDLVLTIAPDADLAATEASYGSFAVPPRLVSVETACELEPLLNPQAIAGALTVKHGHIHPGLTTEAYINAFGRLGGTLQIETVTGLLREGDRITGVLCGATSYTAGNVLVCAGALSRLLLKQAGIAVPQYFTYAELVETPPVDVTLRSLVMPANTRRFQLEAIASAVDHQWDLPGQEIAPPILDAGAIQMMDGRLRLGQLSRVLTDPHAAIDSAASEAAIRAQVGKILPSLEHLPGTWYQCLVAFSGDRLPLIGALPNFTGIHLFSGFSNPLAIVPPLAKRYANHVDGQPDVIIRQLSPNRFA